jgi:protein-S-isoprenylcysteine O-methyltransferase Ste14
LMHYLGDGVFAWVNHWEPYGLAVFAISGVVLTQSALQTGALGAAVGAQEAMAPISAAIFGLVLLHEEVAAQNGIQIFLVSCSLVAVLGGIAMLARAEERLMEAAAAQPQRAEVP